MPAKTKAKLLEELIAEAEELGFTIPSDILLSHARKDIKAALDALKLKIKLKPSDLPLFTLKTPGAVPAPEKKGLVLASEGWRDINLYQYAVGFGSSATTLTAAQILAALLTVDGAGSLLDADLLDGNEAAAFALSGHLHAGVYEPADATILKSGNANWIDLTDGGATTLHTHAAYLTAETDPLSLHLDGGNKLAVDVLHTNNYDLTIPATGTAALGTGTANYVPKWSTTNTLTNSLFQDDGTTASVGGAPSSESKFLVTQTNNSDAPFYNFLSALDVYGNTGQPKEAARFVLYTYNVSTDALWNVRGANYAIARWGEGQVVDMVAMSVELYNVPAAGKIWNFYGVKFTVPMQNGTVDNMYGLYIDTMYGTNNWAFYSKNGLVRHGDQMSIDGSADRQQLIVTGYTTQTTSTPLVQFTRSDTSAGISAMLGLTALGSGANNDGGSILLNGKTSTTAAQPMGLDQFYWVDATHASRKARRVFNVYDTAIREAIRFEADGAGPLISIGGVAAVAGAGLLVTQARDVIQQKIKANGTQTANILEIETSAGADLITVDPSGNLYLATTQNVQLRDNAVYLNSADDGHMDINADVSIDLNTPAVIATGDTYWTGDGSGLPYGSASDAGTDLNWTQVNPVQNTWYDISDSDMTTGELNLVTHDGNGQLAVTNAGRYFVHWACGFEASVANKHLEFAISINGTENTHGKGRYETKAVSAEGWVSNSAILDLAASATINLSIRTTDAGNVTLTVHDIELQTFMLGGT